MAVVGVLVGLWFVVMGAYAVTHAERHPESPSGGWMSYPGGRRAAGVLSVLAGALLIAVMAFRRA